jgi:N-methylhydantoinase A
VILGVDVGGTFTDAVLLDSKSGEVRRAKVPTTPEDQSVGTLACIPALGIDVDALTRFCHGTTTGINAVLQRRGARTALLCTQGTRDLLDTGRLTRERESLYEATWIRPHQARPLVHRRHIREVPGRLLYDGTVYEELDEQAVRRELEFLRDEGIESIAVCLLNSYANLEHERRVVELIREIIPDAYVQSSEIRPVVGEYSRTSAVVIDAYSGPVVARYLKRLRSGLDEAGYGGPAVIMQMNGGVRTLEHTSTHFPAYTLESGPVAGLLGAEYWSRSYLQTANLICMDIGGTSTDIGLIIDGVAQAVDEWEVEWALPLGFPAIDVRSIGAGGGSLLQVDKMGTFRVGPESAGALPGPASYGMGGVLATITDAHVVLGALTPDRFLGGAISLDVDAAAQAIGSLASVLQMTPLEVAAGAVELMNRNIESEITKTVFDRGMHVHEFALFAYGGAGPLHAVDVARAAGIPEVVVPPTAGGFSATGLSMAPAKVEQALSEVEELDAFDLNLLNARFQELEDRAVAELAGQQVDAAQVEVTRSLYGMYQGQSFSNQLSLPEWPLTAAGVDEWKRRFDEMYDRLYGYSAPDTGVTVTTLNVMATGPRIPLMLPEVATGTAEPAGESVVGRHDLTFGSRTYRDVAYYSRDALLAGNRIVGPAVIEDDMTSVLIPPDSAATIDRYGNVRIAVGSASSGPNLDNVPAAVGARRP